MKFSAILSDTIRTLKAHGLYSAMLWISVGLGIIYASLGCSDQGASLFFGLWQFPSTRIVAGTDWERSLLLTSLDGLMDYWMMTLAVFLALFPASTVYPDMMKPGAIDFLLSKPISRFSLFSAKYAATLMFVGFLALVLTTICFLSLWIRLGTPFWGVFWSVGLTMLIFSFIYGFTMLFGILTKSSVNALLLTVVVWFVLWLTQKLEHETGRKVFGAETIGAHNPDFKGVSTTVQKIHSVTHEMMEYLPRTRETGYLFRRVIAADAPYSFKEILWGGRLPSLFTQSEAESKRSVMDILATGLLFNAVLYMLAYWRFATRDF